MTVTHDDPSAARGVQRPSLMTEAEADSAAPSAVELAALGESPPTAEELAFAAAVRGGRGGDEPVARELADGPARDVATVRGWFDTLALTQEPAPEWEAAEMEGVVREGWLGVSAAAAMRAPVMRDPERVAGRASMPPLPVGVRPRGSATVGRWRGPGLGLAAAIMLTWGVVGSGSQDGAAAARDDAALHALGEAARAAVGPAPRPGARTRELLLEARARLAAERGGPSDAPGPVLQGRARAEGPS